MKKSVFLSIVFFAVVASAQAQVLENKPPLDNFYEKVNNYGKKPRPYVPVRESDVMLKTRVWRMVDFREKFNQFLYYPIQPVQDRVSFMSMVMTAFQEGKINAYDEITDDFGKPYTFEEFTTANNKIRQTEEEDLDNPGQMIQRVDTISIASNDNVKQLRIKEDWYIDRQRGNRDIRIGGMAPVIQRFDETTGEYRGTQTLFWIYYDDCRDVFANTESFNRHNSAMRLSYDDVFAWKRFFNSYITKMDNQQDRQIQEYLAVGWQIAQEAERLKLVLLNMEEDLWEY